MLRHRHHPARPRPNPLIARLVHHPSSTLHHWLHEAGQFALATLARVGPIVLGLLFAAIVAAATFRQVRTALRGRHLTRLEVLPPPSVAAASAQAFWANVHALLAPSWRRILIGPQQLTFEASVTGERVRFALVVSRSREASVRHATVSAWPGATLTAAPVPPVESGRRSVGCELRLGRTQCLPIATGQPVDPLRAILAAAGDPRRGDRVVIQVVAQQASRRVLGRAQRAVLHMQGVAAPGPVLGFVGPVVNGLLDLLTPGPSAKSQAAYRRPTIPDPNLRVAREKTCLPCFEAVVRIALIVPANSPVRGRVLRARVRAIAAAYGAYAGANVLRPHHLHRPEAATNRPQLARGDLHSTPEVAALAHLPLDRDIPGLARAGAKIMPPPPDVPRVGKVLGESQTTPSRPVAISPVDACQHLHLLGATGTGKSTMLLNLIVDDATAGRGAVVLDPKGDLVTDVLDRLPAALAGGVVVIDPTVPDPPSLNVLAGEDPHHTVDQLVGVMHRLFESAWGPRTDDVLRSACLTLRQHPGCNLTQVPKLLTDTAYRAPLVANTSDPMLSGFWRWYDGMSEGARSAVIGPLSNKLRAFLLRPFVRDVVGSATSSFSLDTVLDGGLLLCRLPKGILGDETVRLMGSLIVAQVWQAAAARVRSGRLRQPSFLYLDECQNFLTLPGSVEDILAEARGYRLGLVLAHQHLGQLRTDLFDAVSANARSKLVFSCSPQDAQRLERHVLPELTAHDLSHLGAYQVAARLVIDGEEDSAFTLRSRPAPPVQGAGATIRERSRTAYGRSEQQRLTDAVKADGPWVGHSPADSPDNDPDGFNLPGLDGPTAAGRAAW